MPTHRVRDLSRLDRIELAISVGREVDGLWIGASVDEAETADALQRVEGLVDGLLHVGVPGWAIALLRRVRRFRRSE